MSKVGLLAAMKTLTKPAFQKKKKKEKKKSISWDSGLCNVGLPCVSGQSRLGTAGSYKKIHLVGKKRVLDNRLPVAVITNLSSSTLVLVTSGKLMTRGSFCGGN